LKSKLKGRAARQHALSLFVGSAVSIICHRKTGCKSRERCEKRLPVTFFLSVAGVKDRTERRQNRGEKRKRMPRNKVTEKETAFCEIPHIILDAKRQNVVL
jgi:hypothetical protein